MSRFAFVTEDPEYDNIFTDDEGDWEDVDTSPFAEPFTIPKAIADEMSPFATINS